MSLEPNTVGDHPQVAATAYVHPSAVIIGNVRIGANVYVGPHATIRADEPVEESGAVAPITVGEGANIQDGVIVHALAGTVVKIGPGTSVAHGAVVHGACETGRNCFIGFYSVVYDCVLGESVVVMHRALVQGVTLADRLEVAPGAVVVGPDDVTGLQPVSAELLAFTERVRRVNAYLAQEMLCPERGDPG